MALPENIVIGPDALGSDRVRASVRRILGGSLILMAALTGCGADDGPSLPVSCDDLATTMLDPVPTRDHLQSRFGPADSIGLTTQPNRHLEGVTDSIFTVHYPGLTVRLHKPGGAEALVSHATVEDNRYLAFPRIGIGAREDSVVAALGAPTDRTTDRLTYSCGIGAEQPVHFVIGQGRVARVTIDYYVD